MIKSNPVGRVPNQLSFSIHSIVAREPSLWLFYMPYLWWGKVKKKIKGIDPKESEVKNHTELVIDGFQGSANSFATVAFKNSQRRNVTIAHHLHSPAQIIKAVDKDIPVLLTVRDPVGAILSLTGRWHYISVTQALKSYIGFYSKLLDCTDGLVISTFEQTIKNLDWVVGEVNIRFDTDFDLIDMNRAGRESREEVSESEAEKKLRNQIKALKKQEFDWKKNSVLLQEAQELYEKFVLIAEERGCNINHESEKC